MDISHQKRFSKINLSLERKNKLKSTQIKNQTSYEKPNVERMNLLKLVMKDMPTNIKSTAIMINSKSTAEMNEKYKIKLYYSSVINYDTSDFNINIEKQSNDSLVNLNNTNKPSQIYQSNQSILCDVYSSNNINKSRKNKTLNTLYHYKYDSSFPLESQKINSELKNISSKQTIRLSNRPSLFNVKSTIMKSITSEEKSPKQRKSHFLEMRRLSDTSLSLFNISSKTGNINRGKERERGKVNLNENKVNLANRKLKRFQEMNLFSNKTTEKNENEVNLAGESKANNEKTEDFNNEKEDITKERKVRRSFTHINKEVIKDLKNSMNSLTNAEKEREKEKNNLKQEYYNLKNKSLFINLINKAREDRLTRFYTELSLSKKDVKEEIVQKSLYFLEEISKKYGKKDKKEYFTKQNYTQNEYKHENDKVFNFKSLSKYEFKEAESVLDDNNENLILKLNFLNKVSCEEGEYFLKNDDEIFNFIKNLKEAENQFLNKFQLIENILMTEKFIIMINVISDCKNDAN